MVGQKESQSVLLTMDERTTRFRHIVKIPGRSTQAIEQGLKRGCEEISVNRIFVIGFMSEGLQKAALLTFRRLLIL